MKKEIADKWIAALESKEYSQGKGALKNKDGFCCLGVLCDLASKEGVGTWGEPSGSLAISTFTVDMNHWDDTLPPDPVVAWAGLNSRSGNRGDTRKPLWELNDDSKYTFKRIATLIRKEWESL